MTQALRHDLRPSPEAPVRPSARPPAPARSKRPWIWLLGGVLIAATVVIAPRLFGMTSTPVPPSSAAPVKRHAITALGWLEPTSNIVKLAASATVEASRIARLEADEGDLVEAGQVVAVLDSADRLKAQLKGAEAQVDLKRVILDRVRLEIESSVVAKRMAIARAQADFEQAEAEFERQTALVRREFASSSNLEKRKRDLDVAKAQIQEARSSLTRLEATHLGHANTLTQIDVAVAQRELAVVEADLAQTRVLLDQAFIRSPVRGRVLSILTRPGEKISSDGVMEVGSTEAMIAIAEVYHSDIGLVHVGQPAELKSDTFAHAITGVVERVGLKVKRQSVINNDPATDTDARVVEVRIILDSESSQRVAGLTNLQVRAFLKLEAD